MKMLFSELPMLPYRPRHRRPVLQMPPEKLAVVTAATMRHRRRTSDSDVPGPACSPPDLRLVKIDAGQSDQADAADQDRDVCWQDGHAGRRDAALSGTPRLEVAGQAGRASGLTSGHPGNRAYPQARE
jgi:hypothetical protein